MDEKMRSIVDTVKADMLSQIPQVREINKTIPVKGLRKEIRLADRTIPYVLYKADEPGRPLILGFHGGGFLFGGSCMDDDMWSIVAGKLNANIASIDYRKTPDYMWPSPVEDAYEAALYFKSGRLSEDIDFNRISVMGSSAGGNAAAAVSLYAKDHGGVEFDHQILLYPWLDLASDPADKGSGSMDLPMMYIFSELYVKPEDAENKYCSPIFAEDEDLTGLPEAIICTASNDSLKEEGLRYAARLKEAGVKVSLQEAVPDIPHGYFEYGFGTSTSQDFLGEEIKKKIEDGSISKEAQRSLDFIEEHFYR